MLACQACVATPGCVTTEIWRVADRTIMRARGESAMTYAFLHLAKGLAPRRTATIGELFAACSPNFEAVAALYEAGQEVVGDGDPTENFFLAVRGLFRAVKCVMGDGRFSPSISRATCAVSSPARPTS